MKKVEILKLSELALHSKRRIQLEKHVLCILRTNDKIYAFDDHCPHRGGALSEGTFADNCISCPWHHAKFDLKENTVVSGPAPRAPKQYRVNVENDTICVEIG